MLGREDEIGRVAEALNAARVVTLTGAPGIGKTALARELASRHRLRSAIVELGPVADPALVPAALAAVLSVHETPGHSIVAQVLGQLRQRRLLLVFDNCEHLLEACAQLVQELLAGCPELRVLVTSREPLGIADELVWRVPPLAVPTEAAVDDTEGLLAFASVRLFVRRAAAVAAGFNLTEYVAGDVAEICRRLDGIPLAIELAAARVAMLTPAEIAARLDDCFDRLPRDAGAAAPSARHATLQAALDWSHDLLSASERALLRRLSVFVGGFDADGAAAVCAGGDVAAGEVPALLERLAAKSLVVADHGDDPRGASRLLQTVRGYAAARLESSGEVSAVREAHAAFYLALAERAESELTGPCQQEWFTRLECERANVRHALEWLLGQGAGRRALRLATALILFWRVRCHFSEGHAFLRSALATGDGVPAALRAKALWGAGFLALMAGDRAALALVEESLQVATELADVRGRARSLLILGNARQYHGDVSALELLEQSAALAREAGDTWCLAHALGCAGLERCYRDELSEARPLLEECVAVARDARDKQSLRFGLLGLGEAAGRQGDHDASDAVLRECAEVADELGEAYTKATALLYRAQNAIARGRYAAAREASDESLELIRRTKPEEVPTHLLVRAHVARAEGRHDEARGAIVEAVTLARAGGEMLVPALQAMAGVAREDGDARAARRLLEEALDVSRATDHTRGAAHALYALAQLARAEGDAKRAALLNHEALHLHQEIGNVLGTIQSLEAIAGLAADAGRGERAAVLLGATTAQRDAAGLTPLPWESHQREADLRRAAGELSERELRSALSAGMAMSIDDAVAQASNGRAAPARSSEARRPLTETERQVATLAAEGMTNAEIGKLLFVSAGTVKNHLSHIFAKLGIGGRVELAQALAREQAARRDG